MQKRSGWTTVVILVAVVTIAAWSRLRYSDREGYDDPGRWKVGEHPSLQKPAREAY